MKKTRVITLALAAVLSFNLFGCAKPSNESETKSETTTKATETQPATKTIEETTTAKVYQETEVSLVMVGDILIHENVTASGDKGDGTYNFDHLFTNVKDDVKAADLALVNEEVILGGTELGLSAYPCFNGPYEMGDSLVLAGFNVILQATNHTIDRGKEAVLNNIHFWEEKYPDITYLGINETKERFDNYIYVYEKGDIKIAILNYTYGTNGIPLPEDMPYIVNLLDEDKCREDIKKANEMADFVIVCPHWGTEYVYAPDESQKKWAKFFLENGVDLVLGAHPHVVEPIEWLTDGDKKMLCYYSVGNYVSGQDKAGTMVGAMAQVTIANDKDGNVFIKDYGVTPLITHKERGYQKLGVYKIWQYTDDLVSRNYVRGSAPDFNLEFCKNLCKQVFGDLYKEQ